MRAVTPTLFLILVLSVGSSAQHREKLNREWLARDTGVIQQFLPVLEKADPTLDSLEKLFGRGPYDQTELGFGGRTFVFSKPGGYTYFKVSGFALDGRIGYYNIAVGGSSSWARIRDDIIQTWKTNGQLPFNESESGIDYYKEDSRVVAEYTQLVQSQLGELKAVTVPQSLKEPYEYLLSLGNNSVVGSGACDYAGTIPYSKSAIDKIVSSGRHDLIENILRGYNPGGRVYALLALNELQRHGQQLSAETQNTIRVVLDLTTPIETCSGCLHSFKTAREIVEKWTR